MSAPDHVVFLPGFMCDGQLFASQRRALALAGIASSVGNVSRGLFMERIAERVLQNAPPRFALVGLSMGGIVAFEILRQAPERVTHLALVNTTARADTSHAARVQQLKRVVDGDLEGVLRTELAPHYFAGPATAAMTAQVVDMGLSLGPNVFARQTLSLMGRACSLGLLPHISCPTLVLGGVHDAICPPDRHHEMADAIPGARLALIEACGHLSTIERPDAVTRELLALFDRPGADDLVTRSDAGSTAPPIVHFAGAL